MCLDERSRSPHRPACDQVAILIKCNIMKSALAACVLFGFLCSPASAQSSEPVGSEVHRGLAAIHQGNYQEAEADFAAALKADPKLAEVRADLGLAYYASHQYLKAIDEFQIALKQNPSLVTAKTLLPLSLSAAGRCSEAESDLRQGFSSSSNPKMRRVLGLSLQRCLIQSGKQADAAQVTGELLQQYPSDPDVLYEAGQFYGKLSSSIYMRLMRVDPHSARAYQVMASVAASDGHWNQAIGAYRQALDRQPDLQGAHLQIAILLLTHSPDPNSWREALQELRDELRVNPASAEAEYEIGEVYRKHGQAEKAVAPLRLALQFDPGAIPARISLAKTLRQLGRKQDALSVLKAAERAHPGDPSVHFLLAQLYHETGNAPQAEREQAAFERLQKRPAPLPR
jgi:tetratricopeptide (TPR) repeat protein